MRYAADTTVSVERSRAEIESILSRYGASRFGYATEPTKAQIAFHVHSRMVRFVLPLPSRDERRFTHRKRYAAVVTNEPEVVHKLWEQACRQRWRALALAIKAKLEAVECGISTFEEEFLAHIVLPNGESVATWLTPQIAHAYETKRMPPMLLEHAGEKQ